MESSLFDAIKNDLNIDVATIIKDKTKVEILDISPVSKVYAESLARMDYEKDKAKNKVAILDKKSYFDSYYENQVINLSWQNIPILTKIKKKIFSLHPAS